MSDRKKDALSPPSQQKIQMSLEQLELDLNRVKNLFRSKSSRTSQETTGLLDPSEVEIRRRYNFHGLTTTPRRDDKRASPKPTRTTLAIISLDTTPTGTDNEDSPSRGRANGRSPMRLRAVAPQPSFGATSLESAPNSARATTKDVARQSSVNDNDKDTTGTGSEYCCIWPFSLLENRPILRLMLVMFINGILSIISAAIIMEIELPSQRQRMQERHELQAQVDMILSNLTDNLRILGTDRYNSRKVMKLLDEYSEAVPNVNTRPQEIEWNMLSAQAFITSVQTTTGYGDIIPVTFWGKFFTLCYALIGIPIFMWYIFKLGVFFRLVVMKLIFWFLLIFCPASCDINRNTTNADLGHKPSDEAADDPTRSPSSADQSHTRRRSTLTRLKLVELSMRLKQQYYDDKRFHPSIIGTILLVFLCSVAFFISYMEGYNYFDSFYACFITYSTIGFGDIDIFKISYRSNWFNLLIYGNFVHIAGYMILSAWVSSLLEKCGVRKF